MEGVYDVRMRIDRYCPHSPQCEHYIYWKNVHNQGRTPEGIILERKDRSFKCIALDDNKLNNENYPFTNCSWIDQLNNTTKILNRLDEIAKKNG